MARQVWSQEDKLRALAIAFQHGARASAKETGIPLATIGRWMGDVKRNGAPNGTERSAKRNETERSAKRNETERPKPRTVMAPTSILEDGLSDQEQRFVLEYLVDVNTTKAALRAGYSPNYARHSAYRLLKKPAIKKAIEAAQAEYAELCGADAFWVRFRLRQIADRCAQAEPVLDQEGNPTGEYRFDAANTIRAIVEYAKLNGLYPDTNVNLTHGGEVKQTNEQHYHIIHELISDPEIASRIEGNFRRRVRDGIGGNETAVLPGIRE